MNDGLHQFRNFLLEGKYSECLEKINSNSVFKNQEIDALFLGIYSVVALEHVGEIEKSLSASIKIIQDFKKISNPLIGRKLIQEATELKAPNSFILGLKLLNALLESDQVAQREIVLKLKNKKINSELFFWVPEYAENIVQTGNIEVINFFLERIITSENLIQNLNISRSFLLGCHRLILNFPDSGSGVNFYAQYLELEKTAQQDKTKNFQRKTVEGPNRAQENDIEDSTKTVLNFKKEFIAEIPRDKQELYLSSIKNNDTASKNKYNLSLDSLESHLKKPIGLDLIIGLIMADLFEEALEAINTARGKGPQRIDLDFLEVYLYWVSNRKIEFASMAPQVLSDPMISTLATKYLKSKMSELKSGKLEKIK